ncbi:MAG: ABC transporter permease, partial [Xanthomonadales bacterium]|nr:ABC transporter permease [Xanthomonadales bacterium]
MNRQRTTSRGGTGMRMRGLIRKEFLQIVRDPSAIAIAFLMPVILLFLFGYGVSLDAKDVPLGLVVEYPSAETTAFTQGFLGSDYFATQHYSNLPEAEAALVRGEVAGIVHLQADFARKLAGAGQAPIQVIVNGVDSNTAHIIKGYVQGAWANWLERIAAEQGRRHAAPVELE